jgi:phosphoglucomutase
MGTTDGETVSQAMEKVDAALARGQISAGGAKNLKQWLLQPHYAKYQPALLELIDRDAFEELDARFWEVIDFGTGGRRGEMGDFGSATINERTIAESAHGLAVYLKQVKGQSGGRAVIAYDTRNRSPEFARLTASTLAAHGLQVFFFESHRSTPELSFAVRYLSCDVGVMITASHNPPPDNGFKAYWSNGAQVLPPHDKGIIECVYQAGEIPSVDFDEADADGRISIISEQVDRDYLDAVLDLSLSNARKIPAIYSPLHGVGETSISEVLKLAGFKQVRTFEPHRAPDGNFPNVPDQLPNPERPEVFAPLIAEAQATGAELVLASDPDADRLGAAVRDKDGSFTHLTGNRIGALLVDYVLRKRSVAETLSPRHYVVETLVTTPLIAEIARAHRVRVIDDLLVGFKYIGQTMDQEGPDKFVFGAEESLGYLAGQYCRDKDAAVAALYLLESAAELKQQGLTLLDRLDELYLEHGYFLEDQRSEVCRGPRGKEQIDLLMRTFRENPPGELGGIVLARVRDYATHEVRRLPDNQKIGDLPSPKGDLMMVDSALSESSATGCQITMAIRPSGTEPKIKFYFFARTPSGGPATLAEQKQQTADTLTAFQDALSQWVQQTLSAE